MFGYIYKLTNLINNKVYIGQTTKTVEDRFAMHKNRSTAEKYKNKPLYAAARYYSWSNFSVETIDCAETQQELNKKERYWINYYNSIENGYNILEGGADLNPMANIIAKQEHDNKMRSPEVRAKISKTMSEYRTINGFSEEHKRKIKEARAKRKEERRQIGLNFYEHPEHMATRSIKVYCILNTGEQYSFASILDAGKWWYETFKPFGDVYSTATYQRKILASISNKPISFGNKNTKCYKEITNIKWFREGGDA